MLSSFWGALQTSTPQSGAQAAGGNTLYYMHADHPSAPLRTGLGSSSLTTDASGAITARQFYYPYGEIRQGGTGSMPTDVGFTGQRLDDTGLMHYGARYYNPLVARFVSADTIVPNPSGPQHLNRYSYVSNNPVKYTDPSGHKLCNEQWGCEGQGGPSSSPPPPPPPPAPQYEYDWEDNPRERLDYIPILVTSLRAVRDPVEFAFNPWLGLLDLDLHSVEEAEQIRHHWKAHFREGLYEGLGKSYREIVKEAGQGMDNPLPLDRLTGEEQTQLLIRAGWRPYDMFLGAIDLCTGPSSQCLANYEPVFLESLMIDNKDVLKAAKVEYRQNRSLFPMDAEIEDMLKRFWGGGP